MPRLWAAFGALVVLALPASVARSATWTEVPSGTNTTIAAIDYRGGSALWYATTTGLILKNGATKATFSAAFNDLKMSPDASSGLAGGEFGRLYRSTNGGESWSQVALSSPVQNSCSATPGAAAQVTAAITGIAWLNNTTAVVVTSPQAAGEPSHVLVSNDSGATFSERNRVGAPCAIDAHVTDVAADPATGHLLLVGRELGTIFFTSDALATAPTQRGASLGCSGSRPRISIDPSAASRVAAADRCGGLTSLQTSSDGGVSWAPVLRPDGQPGAPAQQDVEVRDGTAVWVGDNGSVMVSVDLARAYSIPAAGTLSTHPWRAVGLASANDAVVGGLNGKMIRTQNAGELPDVEPPTAVITAFGSPLALVPIAIGAVLSDGTGSGVDLSSVVWTATKDGVTITGTGNPGTLTFPGEGVWTLTLSFRDNAGNASSTSMTVTVGPAPKQPKIITKKVKGGKLLLKVPKTCVAPGTRFKVTLVWRREKRKGNLVIKVYRSDFFVAARLRKIDKTIPFVQRLTVAAGTAPGSKVEVRARAYIKVKKGDSPKKSVTTTITTCT